MTFFDHRACDIVSKYTMNFAFIVNDATIFCFIRLQDTTPPTRRKMYPEVYLLESTHPAKFESKYPTTSKWSDYQYVSVHSPWSLADILELFWQFSSDPIST